MEWSQVLQTPQMPSPEWETPRGLWSPPTPPTTPITPENKQVTGCSQSQWRTGNHQDSCPKEYLTLKDKKKLEKQVRMSTGKCMWLRPKKEDGGLYNPFLATELTANQQDQKLRESTFGKKLLESTGL